MTSNGTLYGIGTGPGDPELLTLKGWRLLNSVDVVAYPQTETGKSLARDICRPFIQEESTELPFVVPMSRDRAPARAAYDKAAADIADHLKAGRHVACLCEGDPFFFGSFMYLFERLAPEYTVQVVPGVSSLTASAAASARPLAARNDVLSVLPATLPARTLTARIKAADSIAIIKIGRHFTKVLEIVRKLDLVPQSIMVEAASGDNQRVTALTDVSAGHSAYFASILIYKGGENW